MPTANVSREAITGHLFSCAVEAVNAALRKVYPRGSVDQTIMDGHFEPAVLMLWVAAREQVYERHLAMRREVMVADFLAQRFGAAPPASLTPSQLLEILQAFTVDLYGRLEELREETALVREGIFTLVLNHPLGMMLGGQESERGRRHSLLLRPHPAHPQRFELTLDLDGRSAVEIQVHGRVRKGNTEVQTPANRSVWHVYLVPPDAGELEGISHLFEGVRPAGQIYTWAYVVEALRQGGKTLPVKPLGELPNDLIGLIKSGGSAAA
jgi:hypothetical protein